MTKLKASIRPEGVQMRKRANFDNPYSCFYCGSECTTDNPVPPRILGSAAADACTSTCTVCGQSHYWDAGFYLRDPEDAPSKNNTYNFDAETGETIYV